MNRRNIFVVLVVMVASILALSVAGEHVWAIGQAQSPDRPLPKTQTDLGNAFTHQGFLQLDGAPVNGGCDFTFALFDASTGGAQVGATEAENAVAVNQGRFSVLLNELSQFGPDAFTGQRRWLEVAARCPAGSGSFISLSPRQRLTAAPFAHSLRPGATISGATDSGILNLTNSQGDGVHVDSAATTGIYVGSAGDEGVYVESAGDNGLQVESAAGEGVRVQSAGTTGVIVNTAGTDGMRVFQAGSPSSTNPSIGKNGFEVAGAEGWGLFVGRADEDGVYVDSADRAGVYVDSTSSGVIVNSAINYGLSVLSAGWTGVSIGSAGINGVSVFSAGSDGLYVGETGDDGVDVAGDDLAGYFFGHVEITGFCVGCNQAIFGVNSSQQPLEPGTIVALQGAQPAEVDGVPLLLEVGAASSGQPSVGVVQGRAELVTVEEPRPQELGRRLIPREGAAAPGEYVTIIIVGLAQVQVSALEAPISAGDQLAVNEDGAARRLQTRELDGMTITEGAPTVGIALEGLAAGQEGLVWVLVGK